MTRAAGKARNDARSLSLHGWVGLIAILGLFGGLAVWAAATEISGAIISSGTLMVQSNAKQVQHPEGGVVSRLLVRNEDFVTAGQLLVVLDQTALAAALEVSEARLRRLLVQEARLLAEIDASVSFDLPPQALDLFGEQSLRSAFQLEMKILNARRATKVGRIDQLQEQIVQLDRQREGLLIQQAALEDQIEILQEELDDFEHLFESQLIPVSRGTALNKDLASVRGQLGQTIAAVAESNAAAAEKSLQMAQIDHEYLSNALSELTENQKSIDEISQKRLADQDRMTRTEIRAPQSGIVHESLVHTVGGVVPPGETLMLVVPTDDPLVVSSRIQTVDIDRVHVGQAVVLRFPGLNPRTVPELLGEVVRIAPDITQDAATGVPYYSVRISISDQELLRLPDEVELVPGMPVESYIQIADRTVLAYLVQPVVDHLRLALREE